MRRLLGSNHTFRAFEYRPFALLWAASLFSSLGTWIERVTVAIYVTETTGMSTWTGLITAFQFVPSLVVIPIAGVLADRFDLRKYLGIVTLIQASVAWTMFALAMTDRLSLQPLAVLVTLTGISGSLLVPGFHALLASALPREHLTASVALNSAQFNLARVLGPATAAVVIATSGAKLAFALNALSFMPLLFALLKTPARPHVPSAWTWNVFPELKGAFKVMRADVHVRSVMNVAALNGFWVAPFVGLAPAFALKVLLVSPSNAPWLTAAQGFGAVLASLVTAGFAERIGQQAWIRRGCWSLVVLTTFFWLSPNMGFALPVIFLVGFNYSAVMVITRSVAIGQVPMAMQARAAGIYSGLLDAAYASGVALVGWLGDHVGLDRAGVGVCCIYALMLFFKHRRARV